MRPGLRLTVPRALSVCGFEFTNQQTTDVVFGGETVRTLWRAVDDGVEALGDGFVDDRLQLACFRAKLLDLEHLEEEPLDDAVVLKCVSCPENTLLGEFDTPVLLVVAQFARL